jgi:hypothetical protein
LGVGSENTIEAWARMGLLRSRSQPNGRVQVLLEDVLKEGEAREALSAVGGRDLTEEEMEAEHRARPGTVPWERGQVQPAR